MKKERRPGMFDEAVAVLNGMAALKDLRPGEGTERRRLSRGNNLRAAIRVLKAVDKLGKLDWSDWASEVARVVCRARAEHDRRLNP